MTAPNVRNEQIRTLYSQSLPVLFANVANAMIVSAALWSFVELTNVGMPYILRSVLLGILFVTAFFLMKDLGFTPAPGKGAWKEVRLVIRHSLDQGWRNPPSTPPQ